MEIFIKYLTLFLLYSFIGWIIETIYCSIKEKRLVNRGFLRGPYCPMYGFSALIIIEVLNFFTSKLNLSGNTYYFVLFLIASIISTVIEYYTGLFLDKVCKMKLWDYSMKPMNLSGYVCLEFSIYWGVIAFILMVFINPSLTFLVEKILLAKYRHVVFVVFIGFLVDLFFVVRSIIIFNNVIKKINILNIKNIINKLKNHKRLLSHFEPNFFYNTKNKKIRELKEEIFKKILKK